jgi:hypothetical protein
LDGSAAFWRSIVLRGGKAAERLDVSHGAAHDRRNLVFTHDVAHPVALALFIGLAFGTIIVPEVWQLIKEKLQIPDPHVSAVQEQTTILRRQLAQRERELDPILRANREARYQIMSSGGVIEGQPGYRIS